MKIKDRAKPALPPVPAGQYLAVCVGVYDLGEQYSEKFKNYSPKIMISFDIPTLTIEVDGKQEPRQLSREFTISGKNNSKLRAFISSWNGTQYSDEAFGEFDPLTQIGKPAMINVLLNETGEYANIDTIMPLFPGLPAPTSPTPLRVWDMDNWDDKAFEDLPAWVQEKIKKSSQYQKEHVPQTDVMVQPGTAAQPVGNVMPGMDYQAILQQMMNQQTTAAPTATLQNNGGVVPF
jgi:hypothetical protein